MKGTTIAILLAVLSVSVSCLNEKSQPGSKTVSPDLKTITVYSTSFGTDQRIAVTDTVDFTKAVQPLETEISVFVNTHKTFQTFLGIGGAITDASAETFYKLPDKKAYPGMNKITQEILKATFMVAKFMGVAFLITAIINFYVPEDLISWIINGDSMLQVALAALIGIPMYTSNITALPMVGGLIEMGLNKGAALSFLIAGATTTLPAMVAVWGITKKRIFLLYISFALIGSLMTGLLFNLLCR